MFRMRLDKMHSLKLWRKRYSVSIGVESMMIWVIDSPSDVKNFINIHSFIYNNLILK